jgi:DNA polymerase (family 10)
LENSEVAKILYEIADYLELQGVAFKPQAYRRAASSIESLEKNIDEYREEGKMRDIPGVGEAIEDKVTELITTGKLGYLDKLRAEIPPGIIQLLEIPEVGPKKAMVLYKELGIKNVEELKKAIAEQRLRTLKGFGAKTEERIAQGIGVVESRGGRSLLGVSFEAASAIIARIKEGHPSILISMAGSLRRMKETIGDIDILVGSEESGPVMDTFTAMKGVKEVLAKGDTKSSVRLSNNIQVDLRVVQKASWGAALQYFTGSKEHNVAIRKLAISKGMKISEYGLFDRDSGKEITAADEVEVYRMLGLQYIPPELREDRGEIPAALKGKLPELIGYGDLKGDLHCHTEWSDAFPKIEEVWKKAKDLGYEYVAITDHSQSLRIAPGLSEEKLMEQVEKVKGLRESLGPPFLLMGSEVDLLVDGKLDYPHEVLEELDFAIMSVHSRFNMDEKSMTERILAGMSYEEVKVFGHPTGRLIGQRTPYTFDFDKVVEAAKGAGIALEVNSFPDRLDLNDMNVKRAVEIGAKLAIDSDSHSPHHMENVRYGIATARRGWATRAEVVNALPLSGLKKLWKMS